jgi:hypothetical protein
MPSTNNNTLLPFSLPSVCRKKVAAAFDGGTISSDGGVFLLEAADRRLGLIDSLAELSPDARDSAQISHSIANILRERVFAIACGYPDADDLDMLLADPALQTAYCQTAAKIWARNRRCRGWQQFRAATASATFRLTLLGLCALIGPQPAWLPCAVTVASAGAWVLFELILMLVSLVLVCLLPCRIRC